jgi:hypothetical protein
MFNINQRYRNQTIPELVEEFRKLGLSTLQIYYRLRGMVTYEILRVRRKNEGKGRIRNTLR